MDRRRFLRAGALAGVAAAAPGPAAGLAAPGGLTPGSTDGGIEGRLAGLFAPVRGAGTRQDPLRLNANENPLGIAPTAREAAVRAFSVANRYTDDQAAAFRAQLAEQMGIADDEVFLGNGSTEILQMAVQAFGSGGGPSSGAPRIVTADPTFEDVAGYRTPLGTELIRVPLDAAWAHDLGRMREEVRRAPGPSLVYLCNPNNPTGTLTPAAELGAWIDEADDDVFFLVDEAYFELVEDPAYATAIPWARRRPNVVVVRTFSKIYGMAGMRMGYGVAHPETVEWITAWISNNNANQLALAAASASLTDDAHRHRSLETNRAARQVVIDTLDELDLSHLASHTNFVMHRIHGDLQEYIGRFREAGIAVGRPFPPMTDHNRLSLGTPDEMGRWAETLRDFRRKGWV